MHYRVHTESNKQTREFEGIQIISSTIYYFISKDVHEIASKTLLQSRTVFRGVTNTVAPEADKEFHFNCVTTSKDLSAHAKKFLNLQIQEKTTPKTGRN